VLRRKTFFQAGRGLFFVGISVFSGEVLVLPVKFVFPSRSLRAHDFFDFCDESHGVRNVRTGQEQCLRGFRASGIYEEEM
jgi:hypothetical protein